MVRAGGVSSGLELQPLRGGLVLRVTENREDDAPGTQEWVGALATLVGGSPGGGPGGDAGSAWRSPVKR